MRLTIVHLSDIHFSTKENAIQSRLRALASAISTSDPTCKEYAIVLSGDIAQQGTAEEYVIAGKFLDDLRNLIVEHNENASVYYLAAPGNHHCYLPLSGVSLRTTLVKALLPLLQSNTPDSEILQSVLNAQQHYFEFCQNAGIKTCVGTHRVYDCHTLHIGTGTFRFDVYNTALLSTRDEKQGELSAPVPLLTSSIRGDREYDLVVSVFHHPYPWLLADVGTVFRDQVEHTSEIVLTGHQHYDSSYVKQTLTGEATLYSEGDVLQDRSGNAVSGFRLVEVDTGERPDLRV